DRFHLLRLEQLLFRGTFCRDVPDEGVDDEALVAAQRRERHLGEEFASVLAEQRRLVTSAGGLAYGRAQKLIDPLPVTDPQGFRKQQLLHAAADGLLARPPHQRLGVRAPVEDDAVPIGLNERVERFLDDGPRHLFVVDQRLICPLLLRLAANIRRLSQTIGDSDGENDPEYRRNGATGDRRTNDCRQRSVRRRP